MARRLPVRLEVHRRQAVVQERHVDQGNGLPVMEHVKLTRVGKLTQDGGFHVAPGGERQKGIDVGWWYGHRHAFL
jgi:hypothetical protein